MDRTEQIRRVGTVMMLGPLAVLTLLMTATTPAALVVMVAGCSLVGLGVVIYAQLLMDGEKRMGLRERQ